MRLRKTVVSGASVTRMLGVALLASSAAACSSDAHRFAYKNVDQLYTASVPQASSASLASVGAPVPPDAVNSGTYSQAPAAVSQAFPGDYRASAQASYDPTATGSVTGSVVRRTTSPSSLVGNAVQRTSDMARSVLPRRQPEVLPALAAPTHTASVAAPAASAQPFPERPSQLSASVQPSSTYSTNADPVMAPDPMVTGTARSDAGWTTTGATRITMGPGETIYNLSKRYGVPASEIIKANGITDASRVSTGQQILIPVYVYSRQAPVSAPDSNPKTRASKSGVGLHGEASQDRVPLPIRAPRRDVAVLPSAPSLRDPQNAESQSASQPTTENATASSSGSSSGGVYAVTSGDTLSKIARNHGVSVDALKSANGLSGSNIRIGQTLTIPGGGTAVATSTASAEQGAAPKAYTPPTQKAQDGVAAKTNADVASIAPAATGIDKFRWPARGQVITGYAKNENGKRNDGIDISMPTGTPIKAAENGVVIYSGDGLKEYGKTVLIRHDDGLVTVYAHANTLNVSRGDKVGRGQVIASSGMTGVAKTPRLHFEVRKNASPVDPMGYLE